MLWNWSTCKLHHFPALVFCRHEADPCQTYPLYSLVAFFAIVDLLAILPFYIEVALQEDTVSLPKRG
jgi:hypothetical protein